MDASQFHTLINHFPMIVTIIGVIMLIIGYWKKSDKLKRISLWVFFVIALISVAVFGSGEVAGNTSGSLNEPSGDLIRVHQQAARLTFLLIGATGLTAVFALIMIYRRSPIARWLVLLVLALSLAGSVLVTRTTLKGRQIKYSNSAVTNTNSK